MVDVLILWRFLDTDGVRLLDRGGQHKVRGLGEEEREAATEDGGAGKENGGSVCIILGLNQKTDIESK